jgi:hypothetical protein
MRVSRAVAAALLAFLVGCGPIVIEHVIKVEMPEELKALIEMLTVNDPNEPPATKVPAFERADEVFGYDQDK